MTYNIIIIITIIIVCTKWIIGSVPLQKNYVECLYDLPR